MNYSIFEQSILFAFLQSVLLFVSSFVVLFVVYCNTILAK